MSLPDGATAHVRDTGVVVYTTLCAAALTVLYLTNWPSWFFFVKDGPPLYVYHAVAAALLIPLLFVQPASVLRVTKAPVFWWFVAYVLLGFLWLLFSQDFIEDASRVWRLRLLQLGLFCVAVIFMTHAKRPLLVLLVIACVFLATAFNWFDVMRPHRFVPRELPGAISGRGAGMFMNPNSGGEFVVFGTLAALPFIPMRFRAIVLGAMLVGVAPTLSRGGVILAAIVLLGAIFTKLLNRSQVVLTIITVALLVAATSQYYNRMMSAADSAVERQVTRLSWLVDSDPDDDSIYGRQWAAERARNWFLEDPLVGKGLGATTRDATIGDAPHNMWVMLAAEQGIVGLALYLLLVVALFRAGRRILRTADNPRDAGLGAAMAVYGVTLAVAGLFSNNILDESYHIFLLAFLAAAAFKSARPEVVVPVREKERPKIRWRQEAREQG